MPPAPRMPAAMWNQGKTWPADRAVKKEVKPAWVVATTVATSIWLYLPPHDDAARLVDLSWRMEPHTITVEANLTVKNPTARPVERLWLRCDALAGGRMYKDWGGAALGAIDAGNKRTFSGLALGVSPSMKRDVERVDCRLAVAAVG